jgi:phospholipase/lecithinase/hemolysin
MESSKVQRALSLAALLIISLANTPVLARPDYSAVVSFGDSLSDSGNLLALTGTVPQSPYVAGRFSNGPVAVEYLASSLNKPLDNRAFGGATTGLFNGPMDFDGNGGFTGELVQASGVYTGVKGQVQDYVSLHAGSVDGNALYVVWAGANDFEYLGATEAVAASAISNLLASVTSLYGAGARHFLLPNLPDLGLTPLALASEGVFPGAAADATAFSESFNFFLGASYGALQAQLGDAFFITFDVMNVQRIVAANPAQFGFSNVTTPCFGGDPSNLSPAVCDDVTGVFYWDRLHPTTAAHALLGQQMLAAVPEPATSLMMVLGGFALLGLHRRKMHTS